MGVVRVQIVHPERCASRSSRGVTTLRAEPRHAAATTLATMTQRPLPQTSPCEMRSGETAGESRHASVQPPHRPLTGAAETRTAVPATAILHFARATETGANGKFPVDADTMPHRIGGSAGGRPGSSGEGIEIVTDEAFRALLGAVGPNGQDDGLFYLDESDVSCGGDCAASDVSNESCRDPAEEAEEDDDNCEGEQCTHPFDIFSMLNDEGGSCVMYAPCLSREYDDNEGGDAPFLEDVAWYIAKAIDFRFFS